MAHSIGKTIAELRKAKGWTQIELAERLNVSDKAVSKWEKDNGAPSIEFFPTLAEVFDVTIDYLMTGQKESNLSQKIKILSPKKPKLPNYEKWATPLLDNGIIIIEKLMETKIFEYVKRILGEYPIHPIEIPINYFQKQEWRKLFEYAIDENKRELAFRILCFLNKQENAQYVEEEVLSYWNRNKINESHYFYRQNEREVQLFSYNSYNKPKNINEAFEKLQKVRGRIIDELSLKLDKEKNTGDLTKEYFENELAKSNIDMVIIKLCVRLEAILRCDYHYEGDLSEMLQKYCNAHLSWYDDEGYSDGDDKAIKTLNNLRIKRNSIVHSEKTDVELSFEDIQYCIDYICRMG